MTVRAEAQVDLARVDDGSPGAPGANGATFTPSVAVDGDISWTNDGGLPNPPTQNIMGPQGDPGTPGATGVSVTAVEPQYYLSTSDASATGGSWSSTPQTFVSGCYYWTRDYITFSDGTHDTSTEVYNAGMTKAAQDALDAKTLADDTNQYFWYAPTGDDTGAHITEVPQSEWSDIDDPNYHSGGNLLARSNGIAVRDGLIELASFGVDGAVLGHNDSSQTTIDEDGITLLTPDGVPAFIVNSGSGASTKTVTKTINTNSTFAGQMGGTITKTYSTLGNVAANDTFDVTFRITNGQINNTMTATFTKGTSESQTKSFSNGTLTVAYNGAYQITYTLSTTVSGSWHLIVVNIKYEMTAYDAQVDAPYGYMSGGAQIGSIGIVRGTSEVTLGTSNKYMTLGTSVNFKGNAFENNANGLKCKYNGYILLIAEIRFSEGYTVNDNVYYQTYNRTSGGSFSVTGRFKPHVASTNETRTIIGAGLVNADDILNIQCYNGTGARGKVDCSLTRLIGIYIAPVL